MINKIFLDFDEPWWENNVRGFQFLWKTDNCENNRSKDKLPSWVYDLTGFDVVYGHKAVLLGWIGGKGARIIETISEHQIIQGCANLFRYFLKNDSVPEASKCMVSCWASNQFVRGGYSHISKNCDINGVSPATLSEPIWATSNTTGLKNVIHSIFFMINILEKKIELCTLKLQKRPILMLAGEATHDSYYSTTHGAYDTGVKQAQIFLKHVTK